VPHDNSDQGDGDDEDLNDMSQDGAGDVTMRVSFVDSCIVLILKKTQALHTFGSQTTSLAHCWLSDDESMNTELASPAKPGSPLNIMQVCIPMTNSIVPLPHFFSSRQDQNKYSFSHIGLGWRCRR
jgi:hypothetical protein